MLLSLYIFVFVVIIGTILLSFWISERNFKKNREAPRNKLSCSVAISDTASDLLKAIEADDQKGWFMNGVMNSCCLESRPRWIDFGRSNGHYYNLHCSSCGEIVHKRKQPSVCPNCKSKMKISVF